MKKIKWVLLALLLLFTLLSVIFTPVAWIGIILLTFGVYQHVQKSKGKVTFSKPWIIILIGFLFSWISAFALVEPTKEVVTVPKEKQEITTKEEKPTQDEVEKVAADKQEQQKKEEAQRLAEEKRKKEEEAQRLAEEKRKKEEEAQRLAEEQKKKEEEEAAKIAEAQRQKEESERLAEEQKKEEEVSNVYYDNCSDARSAGAAPVYEGQPGYGTHLDRDGDGIGCDK